MCEKNQKMWNKNKSFTVQEVLQQIWIIPRNDFTPTITRKQKNTKNFPVKMQRSSQYNCIPWRKWRFQLCFAQFWPWKNCNHNIPSFYVPSYQEYLGVLKTPHGCPQSPPLTRKDDWITECVLYLKNALKKHRMQDFPPKI